MRLSWIAALALPLANPVASADRPAPSERLAQELAGRTAEKPVNCLMRRGETGFRAYGDTLLFRYGSSLTYVNETRGSCQGPGRDEALVTRSTGTALCRGDLVRIVDLRTGTDWGACTLGRFTPYRK